MLGDRDYMRSDWSTEPYSPRWSEDSIVKKLIMITSAIFFIQYLTRNFSTQYTQRMLYDWGGLTSYLWLSVPTLPEFWRFGTYMFVHGSLMHILLNMWVLFVFGKPVEQQLGPRVFLKLYLLSGLVGALSWVVFNMSSKIPVIGASGAVFGVMGAAAILLPNRQILLLFPPVVMKVRTLVICLAIIDIVMLYNANTGIAHLAHIGGLLGGYIFTRSHVKRHQTDRMRGRSDTGRGMSGALRRVKTGFGKLVNVPHRHTPDLRFVGKRSVLDDETITSEIDPILDKIGKYGMTSLTTAEKAVLERARDNLKDRR